MGRKKQPAPENPQATALAATSRLTAEQGSALRCIVEGRSMIEAATAAGVDRTTLYRWRTEDEKFIAALEAWRREQMNNAYDRLSGMTAAATNVVGDAIIAGDARLAFRMLEKLGAAQPRVVPEAPDVALAPATSYTRWSFRVDNPGNHHAEVQQYVSTLLDGDLRIAGNITYRHQLYPYAADRAMIDAVLRQLGELGASATVQRVEIVKVDEGVAPDYVPGPAYVMPSIMSGPAWAITLPASQAGGQSNRYKDHETVVAYHDALHARRTELEAMDEQDQHPEGTATANDPSCPPDGAEGCHH